MYLDTLAVAHAESGQFQDAVEWQAKAILLAPVEVHEDCKARLKLYVAGTPFRMQTKLTEVQPE